MQILSDSRSNQPMKWNEFSNQPCNLCPRNCLVNRKEGQRGYCLCDDKIYIARAALHRWEEPCISGESGSGAVFFSGCNLRCVYCQNFEIAAKRKGRLVTVQELARIFIGLQKKGAANINLVTPEPYILEIVQAIRLARKEGLQIPIVYNGSGYAKKELIENLQGLIDIFLTDFKYMDSALSERYSFAKDYPEVAKEALQAMVKVTGLPVFDENGMMQKGVIVRHLLLPGHKKNAKAVIDYVYKTYGDGVFISLMNQYTPFERLQKEAVYQGLCRKVTKREYETVVDYMLLLGVTNAFVQEGDTAKESFIPDFDETIEGI